MIRRIHVVGAVVVGLLLLTDDQDRDVGELPTTCRECDENERTFNTFRCPECHPEMTPDDHPTLATNYEGDDAEK